MKQVLLPDHIPVNDFALIVPGGPPRLEFITIDGFEEELDTVDLPDRTTASGGNTKPIEFVATHPYHHLVEDAFLEGWYLEAKLGLPTYKKPATLINRSLSKLQFRTTGLIGVYPFKRKRADQDMNNEGELNVKEWTFKADRDDQIG